MHMPPVPASLTEPATPAISAEIFIIPLEDSRFIIYAPLRRAAFIGNARVAAFVRSLQAGVYESDADPDGSWLRFLRGLQIVDAGYESQPKAASAAEPQPTTVSLFLTTACNLRCRYCYASAGNEAPRFMPLEAAKRAIDFVAQNAKRRDSGFFEVSYHGGGEPTLHWPVLTESCAYAQRQASLLHLRLKTSLATNGVLSEKRLDWVVSNIGGISVSCDGLPAVHDEYRPTAGGKGSSSAVIRTLRRFDEEGADYGIRLTLVSACVASLPDSVEFLCSNFRPATIQIEPVYLLGRGRDERSAETDEFIEAFRKARDLGAALGRHVFFSGARVGNLTNHFCAVSQDNFCISTEGNVTACHEAFSETGPLAEVFFYGRPAPDRDGYLFDQKVLQHLRDQAVERRAFCTGCYAKWSCGGDCYYKWLAGRGGGEFDGSARCHIILELTKDQILEKISSSGGMVWHDPPALPVSLAAKGDP